MENTRRDLSEGVIWKKLLFFFLPMLGSSLVQQLYTTADAMIVGRFAGKSGLAAIDAVWSLLRLPTNLFVGLSVGATILISQLFGARNTKEIHCAVHSGTAFALWTGAALSLIGALLSRFLVAFLSVPAAIFPYSVAYARICFSGFLFMLLFNMGAGILRAVGDSETPFRVLLISGISNVMLDLLFVGLFHWGVAGAAWATIFSQALSALLVYLPLLRTEAPYRVDIRYIAVHKEILIRQLKLGFPIGLQNSLYPISNLLIQARINSTGTDNIAAWALTGKLDLLVWLSADTLAAAISTFVAQNLGANQSGRIRQGIRIGTLMTLGLISSLCLLIFIFAAPLGTLFIPANEREIIPIMLQMLRFILPFYIVYSLGEILSASLRGFGNTFRPMLITLFFTCGLRIIWVLAAVPIMPGIRSILMSYPLSWIMSTSAMAIYCRHFMKKHLR